MRQEKGADFGQSWGVPERDLKGGEWLQVKMGAELF